MRWSSCLLNKSSAKLKDAVVKHVDNNAFIFASHFPEAHFFPKSDDFIEYCYLACSQEVEGTVVGDFGVSGVF